MRVLNEPDKVKRNFFEDKLGISWRCHLEQKTKIQLKQKRLAFYTDFPNKMVQLRNFYYQTLQLGATKTAEKPFYEAK